MASIKIELETESELINQATQLYQQLGLTIDEAFRIFLRQSIIKNGLPLQLSLTAREEEKTEQIDIPTVEHLIDSNDPLKKIVEEVIPQTKEQSPEPSLQEKIAALPSGTIVAFDESEEDTDFTCPANMFDSWDVGEEEDIGCI